MLVCQKFYSINKTLHTEQEVKAHPSSLQTAVEPHFAEGATMRQPGVQPLAP